MAHNVSSRSPKKLTFAETKGDSMVDRSVQVSESAPVTHICRTEVRAAKAKKRVTA